MYSVTCLINLFSRHRATVNSHFLPRLKRLNWPIVHRKRGVETGSEIVCIGLLVKMIGRVVIVSKSSFIICYVCVIMFLEVLLQYKIFCFCFCFAILLAVVIKMMMVLK